jgi:hypothetical protein
MQVQKGLSSGKDTILPQADDRGFRTPRRSLHQSTPHLLSSRVKKHYAGNRASVGNNDMQACNKKGLTKWFIHTEST